MSDELRTRLLVAALLIPVCVAVVYAGGLVFVTGIALLAGVGTTEYIRMHRGRGGRPLRATGLAGAVAFPYLVYAVGLGPTWQLAAAFVMITSAYAFLRVAPEEGPGTAAALTAFGVFYIGGLLSFSIPLRESLVEGRVEATLLFFFPVVLAWMIDTAAYFGGRRWGRRQLAPRISPNKTVEGGVTAVATGVLGGLAIASLDLWEGGMEMEPGTGALFGLVVGLAAVLGDLSESALKRECGVKDSSGLLPGHGGLLDRLDSLLWVFPVAYLFLILL